MRVTQCVSGWARFAYKHHTPLSYIELQGGTKMHFSFFGSLTLKLPARVEIHEPLALLGHQIPVKQHFEYS